MTHRVASRRQIEADSELEPITPEVPKRRKCLRCLEPFESLWAGERVCAKCKRSSTWRSGEPTSPSSTRA
jgi:hypothetical protein